MDSRSARLAAALIALCAALGVAAGFSAVFGRTGSVPLTVWIMVAYFTNLTGLVVLAVFGGIALRAPALAQPRFVATALLATLLVGLVQRLLLYGLRTLRGGDLVGDILLHQVLPVLVPLYWLAFVPKGRLAPRDLALFASYPLIYLGYTLLRGAYDARYPTRSSMSARSAGGRSQPMPGRSRRPFSPSAGRWCSSIAASPGARRRSGSR